MRISDINPDADISVASCETDGTIRIWDAVDIDGVRPYVNALYFKHYGSARLYATEYNQSQRDARKRRMR